MGILRHLSAWLRRGRLDDELRDELRQHVAWTTDRLVSEGMTEAEARRRATIEVGNLTRLREESRAIWGFPSLDSIVQDARYGLRQMRRAPLFTAVAVLSLAIGIGASAAVFSLADALLLRRLPVRDPQQLVVLKWTSGTVFPFSSLNGNGQQTDTGLASTSFSRVAFDDMRSAVAGRMDILAFADLYDINLAVDGRAEVANAHAVSGNYFDVLGIAPAAGRLLGTADDHRDAPPAIVISDAFWRYRFGRSADAIGKTLSVNGIAFTIAGIAPRGFRGTGQVADAPEVFLPLSARARVVREDEREDDANFWWVLMVGRLRDGVTMAQVQPALDLVLKRTVAAAKPQLTAKDLPAVELLDGSRGQWETRDSLRDPLRTMGVVVGIVLLVACANVANLLLARGPARSRELSVRTAIGAPRRRVIRQLFTEGAVLAVLGAALGVVAARWISGALLPALTDSPGAPTPGLDWRLVAFVITVACACAVFFALTPAIRSTSATLTAGLRDASARIAGGRRGRLAGSLVILQLALSMVLVVTAALLARSLRNLDRADLGFDAHNVLTFKVDATLNGYTPERVREVTSRILEALRSSPGVVGATHSSHRLLAHQSSIGVATTEAETPPEPGSAEARAFMQQHSVWRQTTGPDFFSTLRIPIVRGRALDERDSAASQKVMVVNRLLAQQLFKTDDVVGRRVRLGMRKTAPLYEIVGVSGDARYTSIRDGMPPTLYLAAPQQPAGTVTFEVRTAGPAESASALVRDVVRRVDDQLPLVALRTLEDQVSESLRQERLFARLAILLGCVTLALSAIGLYGLLAYGVAQRIPEIGLRMALGAERRGVAWMVLRQSLWLAAAGLAGGVAGAYGAARLVAALLYELPARDPWAMAIAASIMLTTCLLAGYVPARRASRVDPLIALREN
jgi:predicted permease